MNHALFLSAAAVAALSLAACNKPADNTAGNAASNAASNTADAAGNAASNTADATGAAVNKAQDATGAAVGATSANTMGAHDTGAFVSNASQSDMYEIQAGQIAQKRGQNADVKAFGKMMV